MASRPVPMRRHVRRLSLFALPLALVFALAPLQVLRAQSSVTTQHLTVSLLVPPAQLAPGENFTAGLDFRMEEGWHVYWINAGDSGEPPAAKWKLPAGVTADVNRSGSCSRMARSIIAATDALFPGLVPASSSKRIPPRA